MHTTPAKQNGGGHALKQESNQSAARNLNDRVQAVFKRYGTADAGMHVDEAVSVMMAESRAGGGPMVTEHAVRQCVKYLADEGVLYTTVDECHFQCTE